MYELDFHADDYAASAENSRRILELIRAGCVDSISVMTNMGCFAECMALLRENWDLFPHRPLLSAHINLIDGFSLSARNGGEVIRGSWAKLFLWNLLPGKKKRRDILSREIEAQLCEFLKKTKDLKDDQEKPLALRIDSHVHTHMIPLVFDALMEALDRMGLRQEVRFIRCSTEPLRPFLSTPGVVGTISPVNIVKNLILNLLSHSARRKLAAEHIETGQIFGVAMTGEMDLKRVKLILPKMKRDAERNKAYLEVLSHPGRSAASEMSEEYGPDDRKAFPSPKRDTEYQMLMAIQENAGSC